MCKGYRNNRQPQPDKAERISRVCDKTLYIVVPPRTEALRYQYSRTCRKAVTQRVKQERYRACRTDRRQCLVTEITSDYYRIDYIIKLLEQISSKQGQSEHKYVLKLTSLRHISYIFVHIFYRTTLFCFVRAKPIDIEIITLFYGTVNNASCLIYCNCVQIRTGNTVGMTKNVTAGIVAPP